MFIPAIGAGGLAGYRLLERTEETQLAAVENDPQVAREIEYFRENIGSVQTAEDLLRDRRLLSVALTAYGLESEIDKGAFVEEILAGGLEDQSAPANRINDRRWTDITRAFGFGSPTAGQELPSLQVSVELAVAEQGLLGEQIGGLDISREDLEAFRERIGQIDTAAQLVADRQLLDVALTVFGLENESRSDAFLQDVLESDLSDSSALVNSISDTRWRDLAAAFSGVSSSGGSSSDVLQFEVEQRLIANGAPQADLDYLRANFDLVDENINLVLDPQLQDIVLSAFGLEKDTFSNSFVLNMMISDPSEPNSFVNAFNDDRWVEFVSVFGSVSNTSNTGTQRFQDDLIERFTQRSFEIGVGQVDEDIRLALNFRNSIDAIATSGTVADSGWFQLMGDQALRAVVDAAFGLPAEFAQIDVDQQATMLESRAQALFGVSDPSAFADSENVDTLLQRFFLRRQADSNSAATGSAAITLLQSAVDFGQQIGAQVNQRL